MKKLCVICPTRNRKEQLETFIKSYKKTLSQDIYTYLILAVDIDDPIIMQYESIIKNVKSYRLIFKGKI